ncbi:hypothetical protein AB0M20_43515, partial [Actinoplanes sp. NPDC051633]
MVAIVQPGQQAGDEGVVQSADECGVPGGQGVERQNTSQPKPSTDLETQKRILNVLENLESNHEKTTLNLSNDDKLYITRLTERIKRSNEHKINIEID